MIHFEHNKDSEYIEILPGIVLRKVIRDKGNSLIYDYLVISCFISKIDLDTSRSALKSLQIWGSSQGYESTGRVLNFFEGSGMQKYARLKGYIE